MSRGRFIVFEGLDGAGKTSCIDILKRERPSGVLFVREPGGTRFGEKVRTLVKEDRVDPLTELLLFTADRREHMKQTIIPALEKGIHVISDRFMGSTYAYQIVAGNAQAHEKLFWDLHENILEGHAPDLYVFVTVTPEKARERLEKRVSMDRFESEMAFQARVREGYERFLTSVPHVVIDGGVELSIMQDEAVRLVKEALRS